MYVCCMYVVLSGMMHDEKQIDTSFISREIGKNIFWEAKWPEHINFNNSLRQYVRPLYNRVNRFVHVLERIVSISAMKWQLFLCVKMFIVLYICWMYHNNVQNLSTNNLIVFFSSPCGYFHLLTQPLDKTTTTSTRDIFLKLDRKPF